MTKMNAKYLGDLQVECGHPDSGIRILTDAPTDNNGQGRSFSPTDLLASSLVACMFTIMGIYARTVGLDIEGATAEYEKRMSASPRTVAGIDVFVRMPAKGYSQADRTKLERAALRCPVHATLEGKVEMNVKFDWGE